MVMAMANTARLESLPTSEIDADITKNIQALKNQLGIECTYLLPSP